MKKPNKRPMHQSSYLRQGTPSMSIVTNYKRGCDLLEKGDYNGAIAVFKTIVRLAPGLEELHYALASSYHIAKEYELAIKSYQKAISLNPRMAMAYADMGKVYCDLGDYPQCIEFCLKAIALDPKIDERLYRDLGTAYVETDKLDEAIAALEKGIQLFPSEALTYAALGAAYLTNDSHEKGIATLRKAISLDPDKTEVYILMSAFYIEQEEYDLAIEICEQILARVPDSPEIQTNLEVAIERRQAQKGAAPTATTDLPTDSSAAKGEG